MHLIRQSFLSLIVLVATLWSLVGAAQATPLLLLDAGSGQVLFEQEAGQPWHPASLTKLMTAFVTFEAIAEGRVTLETPVILSKKAVKQEPSNSGLPAESALSMKDALYIMLVKSANDVAWAVAETVGGGSVDNFVAEMNATADAIGLSATHFVNPNGLPADAQVTSARDLAVLALYIRQNYPQYQPIFETEAVTLNKHKLESNNDLLTHFAGTNGMKTGFICSSGLNIVATVNRGGRTLMVVLLGGSSGRERNEMTAEMFLRGFSGSAKPTGKSVLEIANSKAAPVDMRPLICGKGSKDYVAGREAAFPMGLEGQPSYLTDIIDRPVYVATDLGRIRNVPLPRQRPSYAPVASIAPAVIEATPGTTTIAEVVIPAGDLDPNAPVPMPTLVR